MNLLLVGLNHKSAPVEVRERLAFQPKRMPEALSALTRVNGHPAGTIYEAVILSTCNRVEIYAVVKNNEEATQTIRNFLSTFHKIDTEEFDSHLYYAHNLGVVEHLFSVISGIDSMVVGETQIQGQVKQAFEASQQYGAIGPYLSTLFSKAMTVGKRVRTETAISERAVSVSGAAVNLVSNLFNEVPKLKVLIIGVGKMGLDAVKSLMKRGATDISIINRGQERVRPIAEEYNLTVSNFEKLESELLEADVVISSTGAPHAVLTTDAMRRVLGRRGAEKCLLIVDLAVPRDVEPEVGALQGVTLLNIDRLETQVEENLERRCEEINRVRDIINEEVGEFQAWYQSLNAKPVIKKLRQKADQIREKELQRALRRFEEKLSDKDAQVVQELSRRIINKMLHEPLTRLREQASLGNGDVYTSAVQHLFDLDEHSNHNDKTRH